MSIWDTAPTLRLFRVAFCKTAGRKKTSGPRGSDKGLGKGSGPDQFEAPKNTA